MGCGRVAATRSLTSVNESTPVTAAALLRRDDLQQPINRSKAAESDRTGMEERFEDSMCAERLTTADT